MAAYIPKRKTADGEVHHVKFPISAIDGLQEVLGNIISGTEIKVSNLKDTSWKLNDTQTITSDKAYEINFTSNGTEFIGIQFVSYPNFIIYLTDTQSVVAWNGTGWNNANYPNIDITGGTDATNTELIDLLYSIGVLKKVSLPNFDTLDNVVANYSVEVGYSTTVTDMIAAIQEMGADISKFNVVTLYGFQSATLGMQINHYGGNVYNINAIDLMSGNTLSNTTDWLGVGIGSFLVMFEGAEGDSANGFEMPQIRFANAIYSDANKIVNDGNPLTLTVELVGGGQLQEGDTLQICVRRTYHCKRGDGIKYTKQKLRKMCEYFIGSEDIAKRFLSVTTERVGAWLFYNDRHRQDTDTSSVFYLRIKRVTKYGNDGLECDAIFSNILTVHKTYNRYTNEVSIK